MNVIETDRLFLRKLSTDDAAFMFDLLNQPHSFNSSAIEELELFKMRKTIL